MARESALARTTTLSAWLCEVARFTDEPAATPPLAIGDRVLDRYEVRRLLGRGGMGFVYDVFDHERGCSCALKTVRELGPEQVVMLKNEFRAIARVRHPNLVRPGELLEERGRWFFTMEIVEGHDPFEWVGGDPDRLRHVIASVADVLAAMHAHGVVHRDIKPSNILVGEHDRVVVIDLGIARDRTRPLWFADRAAGTTVYMPPEQLAGTHPIDPAADLYALGVILYELATGERPTTDAPALDAFPADLAELCAGLLHADPGARPTADTVAARLQHKPLRHTTPRPRMFVGREHELARLHAAFERVAVGGQAAVFVHGPSGMGKTALVESFLADVASQGARVFAGRCYERETVPYKALDGIVDAIADALARDRQRCATIPASSAALGRVFPVLAAIPGFDRAGVPRDLPAALVDLLACFPGPCVLFVDDLQWADHDGLSVLARTLERTARPLLLVATSREHERPAGLAPLANVEGIDVGPLPSPDALRLATLLARPSSADRALLERIVGDSGGCPLLIHEASRLVTAHRDLDGVIAQHVGELGAAARDVLELVVTAGGPLPYAVLAVAYDGPDLEHQLHVLETERLARLHGRGAPLAIDTFHDRVREAVRARLLPARHRALHGRLADAFERVQPAAHAALAVHASGAGRREQALHHAQLAADAATASAAHAHAAELLAIAIAQAAPAQRQPLRVARARSLARAWLPAKAARAYADAAGGAGSDARRLHVLAVEQWLQAGDLERGLAELGRALQAANIRPPRRALSAIGYALERRIQLRLPRLRFRGPRLDAVDIDVLWTAASMLAMSDALLALGYHGRALRVAREVDDPVRLGRSLALEACIQAGTGSFAESARLCAAAERLVGDSPVAAFNVRGAHIVLEVQLGRWREALARAGTEVADPNVWSNAAYQLYTAHCELNLGRFVELAERGDRVRRQIRDRDDRYLELALSVSFLPVIDLVRDEPRHARETIARGRQLLWRGGRGYFHALAAIAELFIELYAGDHTRAFAIWRANDTLLARKSHYGRVYLTYLGACAALGMHRDGPRRETRGIVQRAIRDLARDPIPWAAPYGAVLRAQLAHLDHAHPARDRSLALARAGFAAFGAEHMVDLVDRRIDPAAETRLLLRGIARPATFSAMLLPAFA